ncbi:MAG: protein-disulfide reductase DsbD domain-containing protein [Waddliaceae bacterium]
MNHWKTWLFALVLIGSGLSALEPEISEPVTIQLIHEEESIQPGRPFWVGVQFKIDKTWHTYWKNPGEVGAAPNIDWKLPNGYTVEEVKWPYPKRYAHPDSVTFGYEEQVTLLAKIIPSTLAHEDAKLSASIRYIACSDENCQPGFSDVEIQLPVNESTPQIASHHQTHFKSARQKLPKLATPQVTSHGTKMKITLQEATNQAVVRAEFFPEDSTGFDLKEVAEWSEGSVILPASGVDSIKGTLVLHHENGEPTVYHIDSAKTAQDQAFQSELQGHFFLGLLFAFAGGLLLNLMPCVLPVISFKILGFVKMGGEDRFKIFQHGLMFTLGVVLSFWTLAATMLGLQTYGHAIGWGFQLQNPLFVGILATLIFIFSLSLFGVFELGTSVASKAGNLKTAKEGLRSSFMSGILATAVATPCSGPFLGTAIGFAVTLPAIFAMMIFTALALGLSFPYLIIGIFPSLIRFLPKPGKWMGTFKEVMGFIMLATVLWLAWVFGALTTYSGLHLLISALFIFAFGCYLFGKWGTPVTPKMTRYISHTVTILCFAFGGWTLYQASNLEEMPSYTDEVIAFNDATPRSNRWVKYSPEKLEQLRSQGVPVFVDFTAKWCLICQANHAVLSTDAVQNKFNELGVVRMVADWTKSDPVITEQLRKLGRNSVPLYLYYGPGQDVDILPQVLTPEIVIEHLGQNVH